MSNITEMIFDKLVQTQEYAKTQEEIAGNAQKELFDKIITPLYKTNTEQAGDLEDLLCTYGVKSEFVGFCLGVSFAEVFKKELIELSKL